MTIKYNMQRITPSNVIEKVNQLNVFQKQKIYSHYLSTMLFLKYNTFHIELDARNISNGYGKPTKIIGNVGLYRSGIEPQDFLDFTSDKNIRIIGNGADWQKRGYAQKVRVNIFGIYDWYWKFQKEIGLIGN